MQPHSPQRGAGGGVATSQAARDEALRNSCPHHACLYSVKHNVREESLIHDFFKTGFSRTHKHQRCLPARALFSASALSSSPSPAAASTSIRRSPAFELELPAATREGKSSSCSAGAPAALPSHQVMCSQSHICDRFEIFNIWKIFSCQLHTVHIIHLFTPRTPPCQMTLVQNKVRSGLL